MLKGYKTHIIAFLIVLGSLGSLLQGDIGLIQFFESPQLMFLLNGIGLSTLRAGVKNAEIAASNHFAG